MLPFLYDIVIKPLVYLIELVFSFGYKLTGSAGLAIIAVSAAVNLLCLPLYAMADAAQEAERDRQTSMRRWVDHINARFSGDERVMVLQAYYRLRGYRPAQALVGSLSLLLQIPFFVAAYSCLSSLTLLRGSSFLLLADLGSADALLSLGSVRINLMPILMTALNCASTLVYTRGLPLRDKVQAYGLAIAFLALLYDSPSGLVFYWTCNQLFSLGKNVFMKVVPEPRRWALILAQACALAAGMGLFVAGKVRTPKRALVLVAGLIVLETILYLRRNVIRLQDKLPTGWIRPQSGKPLPFRSFVIGSAFLVALLGGWIPSALISDSPTEFVDIANGINPLGSMLHALFTWVGVLLWVGIYYVLSDRERRDGYVSALWCLSVVCLVDYLLFGHELGMISNALIFDATPKYPAVVQLANLALIACAVIIALAVWNRARQLVTPVLAVMLAATLVTSAINIYPIHKAVREDETTVQMRNDTLFEGKNPRRVIHLSRGGRNVVVLFLDRAISGYLPYIMAERPELEAQFDGFTYYPNTISFGINTMFGAPALYGGYEYTVDAINDRVDTTIASKHNESLLLMPTLFSQEGYQTTVVNPPYAGSYDTEPDLTIYDELQSTDAYMVEGAYTSLIKQRYGITTRQDISRSLFFYSLFKVSPVAIQPRIYDKGRWLSSKTSNPPSDYTLSEFAVLDLLPELTKVSDGAAGLVLLHNELPHTPGNSSGLLQLPDYLPAASINNAGMEDFGRFTLDGRTLLMDTDFRLGHYHDAAASLIQLGKWFDWLREQGVYDNTRIIVVSDHGFPLEQFEGWRIDDKMDIEMVNPLFMVKDFDSTGFATSDVFMTNADTPLLAMDGIVKHPINPFTGKELSDKSKQRGQIIESSTRFRPSEQTGNAFITDDAPWYTVQPTNIFDTSNWMRYETYEEAIEAVTQ